MEEANANGGVCGICLSSYKTSIAPDVTAEDAAPGVGPLSKAAAASRTAFLNLGEMSRKALGMDNADAAVASSGTTGPAEGGSRSRSLVSSIVTQMEAQIKEKKARAAGRARQPKAPAVVDDEEGFCDNPVRVTHAACQCTYAVGYQCLMEWHQSSTNCMICWKGPYDDSDDEVDYEGLDEDFGEDFDEDEMTDLALSEQYWANNADYDGYLDEEIRIFQSMEREVADDSDIEEGGDDGEDSDLQLERGEEFMESTNTVETTSTTSTTVFTPGTSTHTVLPPVTIDDVRRHWLNNNVTSSTRYSSTYSSSSSTGWEGSRYSSDQIMEGEE